jgi:hypothetical protein
MKIHFTIDDTLDAAGVPFDNISLEEKAASCDGGLCGARPGLEDYEGNSLENTADYISAYGSGPIVEHSHIVSSRSHAGARRYYFPVFWK